VIKKCKKVGLAHMVQHHSSNEAFLESKNGRLLTNEKVKAISMASKCYIFHGNVKSSNHLLLK